MDDSILNTIKKMLGMDEEYDAFDQELIIHINSVFSTLKQLGAAPPQGFYIADKNSRWVDFFGGITDLQNIKTYIYLRVRLIFDPPATSFGITAVQDMIKEHEWRIQVEEYVFAPAPIIVVVEEE